MTLSRLAIRAEMQAGRLKIEPLVDLHIGISSIDLTLGPKLMVMPDEEGAGPIIEPARPGFQVMPELSARGTERLIPASDPYVIKPRGFVLGWTKEHLTLPTSLAGRVEGKSSLARLGLSAHITAPTIIAGYNGVLCLEIYNCGPYRVQLVEGMRIAQLVLDNVNTPTEEGYDGQFQNQTPGGPSPTSAET